MATLDEAMQFFRAGEFGRSVEICRQVLDSRPLNADALQLFAAASSRLGRFEDAIEALRRAIDVAPDAPQLHNNLAEVLRAAGDAASAEISYRRALQLHPEYATALNNLAALLLEMMRVDEAIALLEATVRIHPDFTAAHYRLAGAYLHKDRLDEAIAAYERVISLDPQNADAYHFLGSSLANRGRLDEATGACRRAIEIDPDHGGANEELAMALHHMGRTAEAIPHARRALERVPQGGLLLYLNYLHGDDGPMMFREHRAWAERHADALAPAEPPPRRSIAGQKIRVGLASPDFCNHAVARLIEPWLRHHDRSRFELICYSDTPRNDDVTARLKGFVSQWRTTLGAPDEQVDQLIRGDNIDILVDLAGHTGLRMLLFARRPAPILVTHFGYPNTTGLRPMDYRITDAVADPVGMTEAFCTERLLRLDGCAWCYQPDDHSPEPVELPADSFGAITFGSFNNVVKVTGAMIETWAAVLKRVRGSRMVILSASPTCDNRERIAREFAKHGIGEDRLVLVARLPRIKYLALHQQVDIALDAFPYNGGVTTLDSLWMGVPVVTLAGKTHVSRVGTSLLTHVGLKSLVASDAGAYVQLGERLAGDVARLRKVRSLLRGQMTERLADGPVYARRLEAGFFKISNAQAV